MNSFRRASRTVRFSLRLLLVAFVFVGVGLGWVGAQLKWMHDRQQALQWILPLQSRQLAATRGDPIPPVKGMYVTNPDTKAPWSLAIFGEAGVGQIELDQSTLGPHPRYHVERLRSLFPEAELIVPDKD